FNGWRRPAHINGSSPGVRAENVRCSCHRVFISIQCDLDSDLPVRPHGTQRCHRIEEYRRKLLVAVSARYRPAYQHRSILHEYVLIHFPRITERKYARCAIKILDGDARPLSAVSLRQLTAHTRDDARQLDFLIAE